MYWVGRFLSWLWFRLLYRFTVEGAEHLPATGGVVVAPSHASFLDPMAVGAGTRRMLHFLARGSLADSKLYRVITLGLPIVPIERGAGDRAALRRVVDVLQTGAACLVFPEGTRSDDGRLGPLKGGAVMMARQAGVPVVPVAVLGNHDIWPRGRTLPRLSGRLTVRFGAPIEVAHIPREEATTRLRDALTRLGVPPGDDVRANGLAVEAAMDRSQT